MRIDLYLVQEGFCPSREKAKRLLEAGAVSLDGKIIIKPAFDVKEQGKILIKQENEILRYVGRGGLKMEGAISQFHPVLKDKVCMDIGASTGGFTDCLLQNDVAHVYAVDVGHDQLAESLRKDSRVTNLEGTNIKDLVSWNQKMDFICCDVSFISLKHVLPVIKTLLTEDGTSVCLVKPQFEAGKSNIGKKGVVKDRKIHLTVLRDIISFCDMIGLSVNGIGFSPISGSDGNIEYLIYLSNKTSESTMDLQQLKDLIERAFQTLK